MTTENNDSTNEPNTDELWILLHEGDSDTRLAIARVIGQREDDDVSSTHYPDDTLYTAEILYDAYDALETPFTMSIIPESVFYAPLPEYDEWSEQYEDLIDYILGYLPRNEVAKVLNGEALQTNGERGYEAVRFWTLEGISQSITEYSISHGHGPSRYAKAVRDRADGLPEWLQRSVLESELERWSGSMSFTARDAQFIVEIRLLQQELLDDDHEEEITELVNEFNLPYDEYIDGVFVTALDCPNCDSDLIERPMSKYGRIVLECSSCEKMFAGVDDAGQLLLGEELDPDELEEAEG